MAQSRIAGKIADNLWAWSAGDVRGKGESAWWRRLSQHRLCTGRKVVNKWGDRIEIVMLLRHSFILLIFQDFEHDRKMWRILRLF